MLTKDLLVHRRVKDRIHPQFLDLEDPVLLEVATRMIEVLDAATDQTRDLVAESLALTHGDYKRPKVAKGLVKLALGRLEFEAPSSDSSPDRIALLLRAAEILRALPAEAAPADYDAALGSSLDLEAARLGLYLDLPGARRAMSVRPLTPIGLIHRYNLAQVQGLVLHAERLQVLVPEAHVLELRRVLRWLRFCRLVSCVTPGVDGFELEVEGPGRVVSASKKYGLQLAEFVTVVPVLPQFELRAEIKMRGRKAAALIVDQSAGLVSPHDKALGYVPESLSRAHETLAVPPDWRLDPDPPPRHVGAKEMCVPDLAFEHRHTGERFDVELFHRWHKGALGRRLEQLATRPDPSLILGIDRALTVSDEKLRPARVFRFRDFVRFESLAPLLGSTSVSETTP